MKKIFLLTLLSLLMVSCEAQRFGGHRGNFDRGNGYEYREGYQHNFYRPSYIIPICPGPSYIWIDGYYLNVNGVSVWINGYWCNRRYYRRR